MNAIAGLHHVTAISGPPQANLDFYTRTLRQRLVKRTVNFDAPGTYHLYYGDRTGAPGTILTFFPFVDAGPGRAGPGMASAVAYAVPPGALQRWMEALADAAIEFDGPVERFGERVIGLRDPDGMAVELIEVASATAGQSSEFDVAGFHSITLREDEPEATARFMIDVFGYEPAGEERADGVERWRLRSPSGAVADTIDLARSSDRAIGRQGAGTFHHVAFRAADDASLLDWRERLRSFGLQATPLIDRQYFHSIYFREPGGVLFEIATDPPGFTVDEPVEALGTSLKLPPQHEPRRAELERRLPPLTAPS